MKKYILLTVLVTNLFADLTFDEFKQLCKDDNQKVTAISANGQTRSDAITAAQQMAYAKLLIKEQGIEVSSETFLAKAYKQHKGVETLSRDLTSTIHSKAKGIIFPKDAKEPEFYPDGMGKGLGSAKAWAKKNCNSYRSYNNFKKIFAN